MTPPAHPQAIDPELILKHDPFVRGLARRLLRDAHAADDVAQQTWIAAWERPVVAASLRDWLGTVVRRIAGKRARGERREQRRQQAVARSEQLPSTDAIVQREALRSEVVRAVLELAEPYRTVVLLRWFDDLPPRAIARRLGIPVETVRTRQKRALADLRARLDRHTDGDRAAWCALLLPIAFGKGHAAAGGGALSTLAAGVMLMSVPLRLSLAGLALAGVLVATWWFGSGAPPEPFAEPTSTAAPLAAASARLPEFAGATSAPREQVEPAAPTEATAAVKATTGSLRVRARFHDRAPAAGIEIGLYRGGSSMNGDRSVVTDELGEAVFDGERPGRVTPGAKRPDPAFGQRQQIVAGEETVAELQIERGIDAAGIVVDGRDAPIAGAEIVAADWAGQFQVVLGRTGADGTFALRSLSTHCHVGARAPGYGASSMHTITAGEGAAVTLRLVLSQPAATIAGTVFGPDGTPVADATVRVGSDEQDNHTLSDGTQAMAPRPAIVHTDADGRFVATSLPAGKLPCAVRAPMLAPWTGEVAVAAGERREIAVHLQPGVSVVGVVRDGDGAPVKGADVDIGDRRSLGYQRTATGADGAFAFAGLPVGDVRARVRHDELGSAETTLRGAPGERLRWDPVVSAGLVLRGRVVDEDGAPIEHAMLESHVEFGQESTGWFGHASSAADGAFAFKNCKPGVPIRVMVRRHMLRELTLRNVMPTDELLVVRLPKIDWVRVKGAVVGPDGKVPPNVDLHVSQPGAGGDMETIDPATGAFDAGPYPPGELSLRIEAPGFAPLRRRQTVAPGATWDVGRLAFARGGTLELNLVADAAGALGDNSANLYDAEGQWVGNLEVKAGRATGGPYAAGDYELLLRGGSVAALRHPFSIRADTVTKIDLPVQIGVPVELTVQWPGGLDVDSVPLEIVDASGNLEVRDAAWRSRADAALATRLREGEHVVRAARGPLAGELRFSVTAPGPTKVALPLRAR